MKKTLFLSAAILLLSILSCNTTEPPQQNKSSLELTLADTSCTEAWLKLTTTNISLPAEVNLKRTDADSSSKDEIFFVSTADTILYVDSLLPHTNYKYQASSIEHQVSGNLLNITTMDTTSHNFTFQTWTFGGQAGSCTLYDVAIINENDIWAVGEIYLLDSTGVPDPNAYNAVHWDGTQWELKRIYFPTVCGSTSQTSYPAKAIFAFDDGEIWISSSGDKIAILQDSVQINKFCLPWSFPINKIWGTSSNDLYVVGNAGNIAHYQNGQWSRIESGTDLNIQDIYGAYNNQTGNYEILAVASDYGQSFEKQILSIQDNDQVISLSSDSNPAMEPLLSVWFSPVREYYVVGSGIYQKHSLSDSLWENNLYDITTYATTSIEGNDINDVVGVGAFGDFVHFNGVSWKNDYQQPLLSNGSYTRVEVKGNLVVAVGSNQISINSEAVILMGRRQI